MLRRVLGAVAWLLLLNVNVEAADRACGMELSAGETAAAHEGEHHGPAHRGDGEHHGDRRHHGDGPHHPRNHNAGHSSDDGDCKIPRVAECCQAAASCGVTLSSEECESSNAPHDDTAVVTDIAGRALRGSPAPDTPPPKA
jgi:hypothetical protein